MTKTAKLFSTGGSQAVRLPKEFRFPGKTVTLRRTAKGVLIMPAKDDHATLRKKLLRIAGSCPDFPLSEANPVKDVPRDLTW